MLGGYPRVSRHTEQLETDKAKLDWGLFVGIVEAGRVSDDQILWRVDRDRALEHPIIPQPPPNTELGGVSGGTVIALLERGGVHYWGLAGIVSEASAQLELVVAKRADFIREDGRIHRAIV
jgi:hypothetical protein